MATLILGSQWGELFLIIVGIALHVAWQEDGSF